MYLKKPLWNEGILPENGSPEIESKSSAVGGLISSLTEQRVYREVTFALRSSLRDARAEFSFLRLRGLKRLLKFLRSMAESDSTICLFSQSQSVPDLQGLNFLYFTFYL